MPTSPQPGAPLRRSFFDRPVLEVARDLLGCLLVHGEVTLRLTEVEGYAGTDDPGSHAYRGPTPRTEVMFGAAGHLYVYLSYGSHHCVNVVTGPDGRASAVLLRAGEVVSGVREARVRRSVGRRRPVTDRDLARGPGRLTQALGLDRSHDGYDVCRPSSEVRLLRGEPVDQGSVRRGPRVGVGGEGGDGQRFPYRYWVDDEATVSAFRAGARRLDRADPRRSERHTRDDGEEPVR